MATVEPFVTATGIPLLGTTYCSSTSSSSSSSSSSESDWSGGLGAHPSSLRLLVDVHHLAIPEGQRAGPEEVRGEAGKDAIATFYEKVTSLTGDQPPVVMSHKELHFVHIRQGGLYWVVTTTADSSPFTIVEFLNSLSEKSVRMNFALIYELLDEVV
ncbi:hypothetical protein CRUP_020018, partial [Coryphaenoides rupestris]